MRNLKKIFRGRRHHAPAPEVSRRTRLPKPDRGPVTRLTIGPVEEFQHTLDYITYPCWLIQFEGDGYVDWWPCFSRQAIDQGIGLMKSAYPNATVTWLKEMKKDGNHVHAVSKAKWPPG
jgi:hypothetical protein